MIQSPNGNPDGDVQVSPTSHEIYESIADPDTVAGWYDSSGFENGDECAYIFGPTLGAAGRFYNQVIGGYRPDPGGIQQPQLLHQRRWVRTGCLGRGTLRAAA